MRRIREKSGTSLFLGELPKGCRFCHSGSKVVLFIAGICEKPNCCKWYCPTSLERRGSNVSFVNEVQIASDQDIVDEAKLIDAEGAAITGGEPLFHFDRTLNYIRLLKENFGENFHIHLYTNSIALSKSHISQLKSAGLDEIRLHPSKNNWNKIEWCISSGIETGVEIPAIPYQFPRIKALIRYLDKVGAFLNLNEFEMTESNAKYLKMFGYSLKKDTIAAVQGSESFGLQILKWAIPFKINIHYCPIGYKDGIQLKMRYLRRAKNILRPHEIISDDGLLIKAIAYNNNLKIKDLQVVREQLLNKFKIENILIILDPAKTRLEISVEVLNKVKNFLKKRNLLIGIIEELPLDGKNRIQMTYTPI